MITKELKEFLKRIKCINLYDKNGNDFRVVGLEGEEFAKLGLVVGFDLEIQELLTLIENVEKVKEYCKKIISTKFIDKYESFNRQATCLSILNILEGK